VSSDIEKIEISLGKTVETMRVKNTKDIVGDKSDLLEDLAARYTMSSERETHLSAAGIMSDRLMPVAASMGNDKVTMPDAKTDAGKSEDLGDNVELF